MRAQKNSSPHAETNIPKPDPQPQVLKGWQQIAAFLGQPVSVAQRWAKNGMPVSHQGRFVTATAAHLTAWLEREAGGEPIHVTSADSDLSAELKRGLSYLRREKRR